jgi:hypothetical protein
MHALDALPTPDERRDFMELTDRARMTILATSVRNARIEASRNAWGSLRGELRLPPSTRFLLVHLSLFEPNGPRAPQPREFAGLFVDDIRIVLTHRPPLP